MTDKFNYQGKVTQIKLIPTKQNPLVHVKLSVNQEENINALVGKKALSFILDVQEGDEIAVYGHYNAKKQFIIEKYLNAKAKTNQAPSLPSHLHYPSERRKYDD